MSVLAFQAENDKRFAELQKERDEALEAKDKEWIEKLSTKVGLCVDFEAPALVLSCQTFLHSPFALSFEKECLPWGFIPGEWASEACPATKRN